MSYFVEQQTKVMPFFDNFSDIFRFIIYYSENYSG